MTVIVLVLSVGVALAIGLALGYWLPPHGRRPSQQQQAVTVRRILLPFTGPAISRRAFEAAVRLAKAEDATIMPAFLARVPLPQRLMELLPGVDVRIVADRSRRTDQVSE